MSGTTYLNGHTLPEVVGRLPESAILEDYRIDHLFRMVADDWAKDNEGLVKDRGLIRFWDFASAVDLHCRRALKMLRAGKPMPVKPTNTQSASGLRDEDLPQINELLAATLARHIENIAASLEACALLHADPLRVLEKFTLR